MLSPELFSNSGLDLSLRTLSYLPRYSGEYSWKLVRVGGVQPQRPEVSQTSAEPRRRRRLIGCKHRGGHGKMSSCVSVDGDEDDDDNDDEDARQVSSQPQLPSSSSCSSSSSSPSTESCSSSRSVPPSVPEPLFSPRIPEHPQQVAGLGPNPVVLPAKFVFPPLAGQSFGAL